MSFDLDSRPVDEVYQELDNLSSLGDSDDLDYDDFDDDEEIENLLNDKTLGLDSTGDEDERALRLHEDSLCQWEDLSSEFRKGNRLFEALEQEAMRLEMLSNVLSLFSPKLAAARCQYVQHAVETLQQEMQKDPSSDRCYVVIQKMRDQMSLDDLIAESYETEFRSAMANAEEGMAEFYSRQGKPLVCIEFLEKSIQDHEKLMKAGPDVDFEHLEACARLRLRLTEVCSSTGNHADGKKHALIALSLMEERDEKIIQDGKVPIREVLTATAHHVLAMELDSLKDYANAHKHFVRAYQCARRDFGEMHETTQQMNQDLVVFEEKYTKMGEEVLLREDVVQEKKGERREEETKPKPAKENDGEKVSECHLEGRPVEEHSGEEDETDGRSAARREETRPVENGDEEKERERERKLDLKSGTETHKQRGRAKSARARHVRILSADVDMSDNGQYRRRHSIGEDQRVAEHVKHADDDDGDGDGGDSDDGDDGKGKKEKKEKREEAELVKVSSPKGMVKGRRHPPPPLAISSSTTTASSKQPKSTVSAHHRVDIEGGKLVRRQIIAPRPPVAQRPASARPASARRKPRASSSSSGEKKRVEYHGGARGGRDDHNSGADLVTDITFPLRPKHRFRHRPLSAIYRVEMRDRDYVPLSPRISFFQETRAASGKAKSFGASPNDDENADEIEYDDAAEDGVGRQRTSPRVPCLVEELSADSLATDEDFRRLSDILESMDVVDDKKPLSRKGGDASATTSRRGSAVAFGRSSVVSMGRVDAGGRTAGMKGENDDGEEEEEEEEWLAALGDSMAQKSIRSGASSAITSARHPQRPRSVASALSGSASKSAPILKHGSGKRRSLKSSRATGANIGGGGGALTLSQLQSVSRGTHMERARKHHEVDGRKYDKAGRYSGTEDLDDVVRLESRAKGSPSSKDVRVNVVEMDSTATFRGDPSHVYERLERIGRTIADVEQMGGEYIDEDGDTG